MVRCSTFYKHFDDKEAFLRFFLDEIRRDFERHAALRPDEPLEEYLPRMNAELLAFLDGNDALVRSFLQGSQAGLVVQSVSLTIAQNINRRLKAAGECDDVRTSVQAGFLAGGIVNVVQREWLGASDDPARHERFATALFACERSVVGA